MDKKATRTTHQVEISTTMDTTVFPAPRRMAAKEWVQATKKKKGAAVLDFRIPNSTTAGVESKAEIS